MILQPDEIVKVPAHAKIGVVSQTTQPIKRVRVMVAAIQAYHPESDVRFVDTVCQPTKDRQSALEELCAQNEVVVVVGGHNSNNTHQLVKAAAALGARSYHVERADEVDPQWFTGVETVGITAGTSTLDESVEAVRDRLKKIASEREVHGALARLSSIMH